MSQSTAEVGKLRMALASLSFLHAAEPRLVLRSWRAMIPSSFHLGCKILYSQTLHFVFQLIFVCICHKNEGDVDNYELENNLEGLQVEVSATKMQ